MIAPRLVTVGAPYADATASRTNAETVVPRRRLSAAKMPATSSSKYSCVRFIVTMYAIHHHHVQETPCFTCEAQADQLHWACRCAECLDARSEALERTPNSLWIEAEGTHNGRGNPCGDECGNPLATLLE